MVLIGQKFAPLEAIHLDTNEGSSTMGTLSARFSTFDIEDRHGDIVRRSALEDQDGKEIALVWSHQWDRMIGKGVVELAKSYAIFNGQFFLDTTEGMEAYKTVKNMGKLQQYSWGFTILEAEPIGEDAEEDDFWWWGPLDIKKTDAHEVSPVLIGANPKTSTIEVKSQDGRTRSIEVERAVRKSLLTEPQRIHVVPANPLDSFMMSLSDGLVELKAGRKLSAETVNEIEGGITKLEEVIGDFKTLIGVEPDEGVDDKTGEIAQADLVDIGLREKRFRLLKSRNSRLQMEKVS